MIPTLEASSNLVQQLTVGPASWLRPFLYPEPLGSLGLNKEYEFLRLISFLLLTLERHSKCTLVIGTLCQLGPCWIQLVL